MQHHAVLLRPSPATDSMGQRSESPGVLCADWPCQLIPAGGRETEGLKQTQYTRLWEVVGYADPSWDALEECWLELLPERRRRLDIIAVIDVRGNGLFLRLLCGEGRPG